MSWIAHFVIALLLLGAAVYAVYYCEKNKIKRSALFGSFKILFAGVAVSSFVLFIPYYYYEISTGLKVPQAILLSLYSVIRTFALEGDYAFFMEAVNTGVDGFNTAYLTFSVVLTVLAPFFTFGAVLSFFKDATSYFNYWRSRNCVKYIFSELNERSLALAADLRKNHKDALIVFTDFCEGETEAEREIETQARELDAVCFKKDILSVKFRLDKYQKETYFFIMGTDESENLSQTLKLIELYNDRKDTKLYLFSTSVESELVITAAPKGVMKVRRVNEVQSLVYRNLYDDGCTLFDNAILMDDGEEHISVLIVGLGQYGITMLKALTWYCQMDGYKVDITAVDKDPKAKSKFTAMCPVLMEKEGYRGKGDAEYSITVHPDVDVDSDEFVDIVMGLKNTTYVFTALGTDEDNVRVAAKLRMLYERLSIKPVIQAVVHNSDKKTALAGIKNFKKQEYNIGFIGDIRSSYTEKVIIDSELEEAGLTVHLNYGDVEENFWMYEYNYSSSLATAIHKKARIHCKIAGADKKESEMTDAEKLAIGRLEQRRWNAYNLADGYIFDEKRNDLGKMHHNLKKAEEMGGEGKNIL